MTNILTLLTCLALLFAPSWAEPKNEGQTKVHPAVQELLKWAEVAKDTGRSLRNSFINADDIDTIKEMMKEGDDFAKQFAEAVYAEKKHLSFEETPDDPSRGMIVSEEKALLPARKAGERWQFDPEAAEKMIAQARIETAQTDLQSFKAALEQYKAIGGTYPSNEQGLDSLFERPTKAPRPRRWVQNVSRPEVFIDPWGNRYQYRLVNGKPRLSSLGPNGKASDDDLTPE